VFLAGAKLLDSVKPAQPAVAIGPHPAPVQRRSDLSRNRPRWRRSRSAAVSRSSSRRD
jgi:hypothetical protein